MEEENKPKPGRIKRMAKSFVDVPNWMGTSGLGDQWNVVSKIFKNIYAAPVEGRYKESFEQAMQRLNLTEKDLQQRVHEFTRLFLICISLTLLAFIYAMYLLFHGSIRGCFVGLAITFMLGAQAFRYHFWRFQILHRRLGVTFNYWLKHTISRTK
jgi:intracellular multiplication protein IcmV